MHARNKFAPQEAHANDNKELQRLIRDSGEVAPMDFQKYAKRASDIITRAASKPREPRERKS